MNEQRNDFELLRGFVRQGDQPAFAEVVRRHLDLVYATSFRKVQDEGAAQEVAQNVFAALGRKAWQFAPDDSLPAWLYKTTLLEAKGWLRGEMRRRRREQTAAELGTTMKTPQDQPALRALVPLLDEALLSLREKDRSALLLRYYENRPLRAVGVSLGVGEDAAQKRVAGALGRLSEFFQKRGFRTASVGAVAAALEQTAGSAPVSVANAVLSSVTQMTAGAPVALAGPLARLASLSKAQTAVLCAALVMAPITWEWHSERKAHARLLNLQSQLQTAQTEQSTLQTEIDRFERTCTRLAGLLADAEALSVQRASAAEKFAAWKAQVRALVLAGDYKWPADSPFVRIPKSVVKKLGGDLAVRSPGVLTQATRELLGMTPQEREQVETALQAHFTALNQLINDRVYETNALSAYPSRFGIPSGVIASQIWAVPPLGDEVSAQTRALERAVQDTLGPERWSLVGPQLDTVGTDTLRRVLNVDAAQNPQEVAVWISDFNGKPSVGYGWQGNSGAFTRAGGPLEAFKSGAESGSGQNPVEFVGASFLPNALTARMAEWVQQQAAALLPKESAK